MNLPELTMNARIFGTFIQASWIQLALNNAYSYIAFLSSFVILIFLYTIVHCVPMYSNSTVLTAAWYPVYHCTHKYLQLSSLYICNLCTIVLCKPLCSANHCTLHAIIPNAPLYSMYWCILCTIVLYVPSPSQRVSLEEHINVLCKGAQLTLICNYFIVQNLV